MNGKTGIRIASLLVILFSFASIAGAVKVGSRFPDAKPSDAVMAAAENARKNAGVEAEGQYLLSSWKNSPGEKEGMDDVAIRLAEFALHRKELKEDLLSHTSNDQLVRLARRSAENRDYLAQEIFAREYLDRGQHGSEEPEMMDMVARTSVLFNSQPTKAVKLWKKAAAEWPDSIYGMKGRLYAEAVEGIQSIAALEAAHELGQILTKELNNPLGAIVFDWRIIRAAQSDFFMEYLNDPEVLAKDKSEISYKVLIHAHQAGELDLAIEYAQYIFHLVGYGTRISEKAAFEVGLAAELKGDFQSAIEWFNYFLRSFPESASAPTASLYCANCYRWAHRDAEAYAQYQITYENYPNSKVAHSAKLACEAILVRERGSEWEQTASSFKETFLANMKEPLNLKLVWEAKPLAGLDTKLARLDEKASENEETPMDSRFTRLAQVLTSSPISNGK